MQKILRTIAVWLIILFTVGWMMVAVMITAGHKIPNGFRLFPAPAHHAQQ